MVLPIAPHRCRCRCSWWRRLSRRMLSLSRFLSWSLPLGLVFSPSLSLSVIPSSSSSRPSFSFFLAHSHDEEWSAARRGPKRSALAIGRRGARELVPLEVAGGGANFYPPAGSHPIRCPRKPASSLRCHLTCPNVSDRRESFPPQSFPRTSEISLRPCKLSCNFLFPFERFEPPPPKIAIART